MVRASYSDPLPWQAMKEPEDFAQPFCDFLTDNPTVFHAVAAVGAQLNQAGYTKLSERDVWELKKGGKYYVERNGSSLVAFVVGSQYESGNGVAMIAGHVDVSVPLIESHDFCLTDVPGFDGKA